MRAGIVSALWLNAPARSAAPRPAATARRGPGRRITLAANTPRRLGAARGKAIANWPAEPPARGSGVPGRDAGLLSRSFFGLARRRGRTK